MRPVAISAAIFGAALFSGPMSSQGSQASFADAGNINKIINITSLTANDNAGSNPDDKKALANRPSNRPSAELASAKASAETPAPARMVAVQAGDYLMKIAEANGTTYQRLYDANTDVVNPDLIYPGQQLRIPAADEALTTRPLPENAPLEAKQQAAESSETVGSSYSAPARQQVSAPAVSDGSVWDSLAQCEAGGNWAINTGNGFYGGLQFTLGSWAAVGGSGFPNEASREEQIMRGQMLQARSGWGNWPACTAKLGL